MLCKESKITRTRFIPCRHRVVAVKDHKMGTTGQVYEKNAIAILECGYWEFVWNLHPEQIAELEGVE